MDNPQTAPQSQTPTELQPKTIPQTEAPVPTGPKFESFNDEIQAMRDNGLKFIPDFLVTAHKAMAKFNIG